MKEVKQHQFLYDQLSRKYFKHILHFYKRYSKEEKVVAVIKYDEFKENCDRTPLMTPDTEKQLFLSSVLFVSITSLDKSVVSSFGLINYSTEVFIYFKSKNYPSNMRITFI